MKKRNPNPERPAIHAGMLIRKLCAEKGIGKEQIAQLLDIKEGSVYRLLKRPNISIKYQMILSEAVDENLVAMIHQPRITQRPNPLQAVVDNMQQQLKNAQADTAEKDQLREVILVQKGIIEELRRQLEKRQGN